MKELKSNSRSIRMTNTVKSFVESFEGEGFNDKFENLVIYCMTKLPEIRQTIESEKNRLKRINHEIIKQQNILSDLETIKRITINAITYTENLKQFDL